MRVAKLVHKHRTLSRFFGAAPKLKNDKLLLSPLPVLPPSPGASWSLPACCSHLLQGVSAVLPAESCIQLRTGLLILASPLT